MNYMTEQEMTQYFSHNLKLLRTVHTPPVTQQQLANRLHVGRGLIAKYERGMLLPPVCLAFHMASYFNTTMEELLTGSSVQKRKEPRIENITSHYQKINSGRKIQNNG